jgi:hypothetical protein
MAATFTNGAAAPGLAAPEQSTSDTARVASAGRVEGNEKNGHPNFRSAPHAGQALRVIEGERKAHAYLARLHALQADPAELAVIENYRAARKRLATAQARAALLGLALYELHGGACLLVGEAGRCSRLASLQAAEGLLAGIEAVRAEVAALLPRKSDRGHA